eukprot:ctg_807.g418
MGDPRGQQEAVHDDGTDEPSVGYGMEWSGQPQTRMSFAAGTFLRSEARYWRVFGVMRGRDEALQAAPRPAHRPDAPRLASVAVSEPGLPLYSQSRQEHHIQPAAAAHRRNHSQRRGATGISASSQPIDIFIECPAIAIPSSKDPMDDTTRTQSAISHSDTRTCYANCSTRSGPRCFCPGIPPSAQVTRPARIDSSGRSGRAESRQQRKPLRASKNSPRASGGCRVLADGSLPRVKPHRVPSSAHSPLSPLSVVAIHSSPHPVMPPPCFVSSPTVGRPRSAPRRSLRCATPPPPRPSPVGGPTGPQGWLAAARQWIEREWADMKAAATARYRAVEAVERQESVSGGVGGAARCGGVAARAVHAAGRAHAALVLGGQVRPAVRRASGVSADRWHGRGLLPRDVEASAAHVVSAERTAVPRTFGGVDADFTAASGRDMHFLRELYYSRRRPMVGKAISVRLPMVDPLVLRELVQRYR